MAVIRTACHKKAFLQSVGSIILSLIH